MHSIVIAGVLVVAAPRLAAAQICASGFAFSAGDISFPLTMDGGAITYRPVGPEIDLPAAKAVLDPAAAQYLLPGEGGQGRTPLVTLGFARGAASAGATIRCFGLCCR